MELLAMVYRIFGDWKYLLMLVVTVAGVAGPLWLWHIDQNGKSVSAFVLSQVALQPTDKESVQGLQVLIEGTPLVEPYLSVIQFSNDGGKPIGTSDFEAPLEVRLLSKANVARARVTGKSPDDIEAEISWDKKAIRLKPLLLNPKDKITISVLTSGGQPQFATKARIAGISSVPLIDATKPISSQWWKWGTLTAALLFAIAAMATNPIEMFLKGETSATLHRRMLVINFIVTGCTGVFLVNTFLEATGYQSFWNYMLLSMALFMFASFFASKLNRIPNTTKAVKGR